MSDAEPDAPITLADLEAEITRAEEELAELQGKIDSAVAQHHATGKYADPSWFARIKARKRHTGQRHQALLRQAASMRRAQRQADGGSFEQAFIDVARLRLAQETFHILVDEARETVRG